MRRFAIALAILLVLFVGCPAEEEEEPTEGEPPPPTPEEIAAKITNEIGFNNPLPAPGSVLKKEDGDRWLSKVRSAYAQNSRTPEGKKALRMILSKIDERARYAEQIEGWKYVLVYCEAHDVFNPGSTKFDRLKKRADVELRKPKVRIKGLPEAQGEVVAMLVFTFPLTGQSIDDIRMRVGEELHGLRLVDVVGNNKGLIFEYLETGETFEVLTKAAGGSPTIQAAPPPVEENRGRRSQRGRSGRRGPR